MRLGGTKASWEQGQGSWDVTPGMSQDVGARPEPLRGSDLQEVQTPESFPQKKRRHGNKTAC